MEKLKFVGSADILVSMPASIVTQESLTIGQAQVIQSPAPKHTFVAMFEDDGQTGYFYACDSAAPTFILDAMHIYNVKEVTNASGPYQLDVAWTDDGTKAALFLNKIAHAVIDFSAKRGYCRSNFPPPSPDWARFHPDHAWTEAALNLLK